MRKRKIDIEEMAKLMDDFDNIIKPWCKENKLSLHNAFEISRATDEEKYKILSGLWSTTAGKAYLKSLFKSRGGVLS